MKIISVGTMRRLEAGAVESGTSEYRLMRRAGAGAAAVIEKYSSSRFRRAVFFCGGGNNAGDAIVCAGLLNIPHVVIFTRPPDTFKGAAAEAYKEFAPCLNTVPLEEWDFERGDVLIDALLGIGFKGGELRPSLEKPLKMMAESGKTVIAFDLPSGLDGDSGIAAKGTPPAALTITFGLPKQGLFLNDGPRFCGKIAVVPIGVENADFPGALPYTFFTGSDAARLMPGTSLDAHKNSRGRILLLCGSTDYPGAAVLASKGALYFAGLVRTISVQCPNMPPLPAALIARLLPPDPTGALPAKALEMASDMAEASDVLCAGCGWGSHVSPELLKSVLKFPGKVLLDADALNLLARHLGLWNYRSDVVLTPHPGEALRLAQGFGINAGGSREEFAARLASRLGCTVVLKGYHTCVATSDGTVSVNSSGGPELAMAGSGDVLAGIIAALGSQIKNFADAARVGVFFHGAAGDAGHGAVIADELPRLAAQCSHLQRWW